MSGKFKTISSSLYTNNNVRDDIPEWLEGISELELKSIEKIDLDISPPKGIFAEKNTVNRDDSSGELRYIHGTKLSLDRMVIDSKIQLANFLRGKYYKTEAAANGEEVQLLTKLDGVNGDFIFRFRKSGSKIANNSTFVINVNDEMIEYPFNKSGLEECIKDVKSNKITSSKKVESIGKASFFNKEEIIRRYNGSLRQATDKINELIKSGDIIGAGSNTFASYYDIDYLFPSMEKETIESPMGAFEFVPNAEHVATNEYKNEESFVVDTDKIFKNIFADYKLLNLNRKSDSLYINAQVLDNNGIVHEANFNFDIMNEKICDIKNINYNNNDFTLNEFINKINDVSDLVKKSNTNLKKIYNHQVYTRNKIKEKLAHLINNSLINDVIDSWVSLNLITPINSELFTSKKSFAELLSNIHVAELNEEEKNNIKNYSKKFGEGLDINRYKTEDIGIREIENNITSENLLPKCNQYISKYIKKYSALDFKSKDNNVEYTIKMFNDELGLNNTVKLILGFDDKKITNCYTEHNGEKVGIEKIASIFVASELLKLHLANNPNRKNNSNIVFSKDSLKQTLSKISSINDNEIEELVNNWEKNNKITKISSREFASKYTFEELLNMSNIKPLSDDEIKEKFTKAQRNKMSMLKTGQYNIMDQENRQLIEDCAPEKMLIHAKVELNKLFKSYDILDVNYNNNSYDVIAKFVNPNNGLKQKLTFKFAIINNKPSNIVEINNSEKTVKLAQIGELINNTSEVIQHYLKFNKVAEKQYNTIITKNQLMHDLKQFENSPQIDDVVEILVSYAIMKPIGNDKYGSLYSMTEVISNLEKMGLINEIDNTKLKIAQRENIIVDTTNKLTMDTDNRILEAKPKELSPKMIELKDKIKNTVDKALNNKIITSKKHFNLNSLLSEAKSERDLENIWKDFSNYIK